MSSCIGLCLPLNNIGSMQTGCWYAWVYLSKHNPMVIYDRRRPFSCLEDHYFILFIQFDNHSLFAHFICRCGSVSQRILSQRGSKLRRYFSELKGHNSDSTETKEECFGKASLNEFYVPPHKTKK